MDNDDCRDPVVADALNRLSDPLGGNAAGHELGNDLPRPQGLTGKGTEFVVVMSDEPQGGLKHRRPYPRIEARYDRPYWRSPFAGQYSTWWPRF